MKIALIGYGKMGHEIAQVAVARGHEIVCVIDKDNKADFDSPDFGRADVAIEFTAPDAAFDNFRKASERGVKVVSGTTGWMDNRKQEVEALCSRGATLFWASNFSLGVAIFSALNKYLAHIMNRFDEYDVALTETHHIHKLDAPSGTAVTLAEQIISQLDRKQKWVKGETGQPGELSIRSIREGEVAGIHTVRYESEADIISLTHEAKNRKGFALGAVLAAEYTATHSGRLGMSDLFDFLN